MPESAVSISEPQLTYTLNQFISLKDVDRIVYRRYSIMQRSLTNEDLIYCIDNVIYIYLDEMKEKRKIVTVTESERIKYEYKPKLLAYDIYNSTELFFILLALNGMCNFKQFDLAERQFFALTPQDCAQFMSDIYNAELDYLNLNRASIEVYES